MTLAILNQDKTRIYNKMIEAMHNQDAEAFKIAFEENAQLIQKEVLEKAKDRLPAYMHRQEDSR